jgi:hypothetical protein
MSEERCRISILFAEDVNSSDSCAQHSDLGHKGNMFSRNSSQINLKLVTFVKLSFFLSNFSNNESHPL